MTRSLQSMGAGAAMLAAVGITAFAINSTSNAQDQRATQPEVRHQDPGAAPAMPRRQEPGMGGRMDHPPMERPMMMGMGPATMIDDDDNLYILRGHQIFKVSKKNMQVTAEGHLPMPQGQMGRGGMERGAEPMPPDRLPPSQGSGRP